MLSLAIPVRAPYDWPSLRRYLAVRATPGVEAVADDGRYWRTLAVDGCVGVVSVGGGGEALDVAMSASLAPVRERVAARVRRTFDADADGGRIDAELARDATLRPMVARRPGLRVAGAPSGFELALRAVLGQQVSV